MSGTMPKFVDKIDPFHLTNLKKQRKNEGSSRFRAKEGTELKPLPLLKGMYYDFRFWYTRLQKN